MAYGLWPSILADSAYIQYVYVYYIMVGMAWGVALMGTCFNKSYIANTRAGLGDARSSAYSTEQLDPVSELHSMYARARAQAVRDYVALLRRDFPSPRHTPLSAASSDIWPAACPTSRLSLPPSTQTILWPSRRPARETR